MIKKLHKIEIKIIRQLFFKEIPFLDLFLKCRNLFSSRKITLSSLQSTASLKLTDNFYEQYKEEKHNYNFNRVHESLANIELKVPAIGYYKLKNVLVNTGSHLFNYNKSWYFQEIPGEDCADWAHAGKHFIANTPSQILSYELSREFIENGIFIGGHWSVNWFHWVLEIGSKVALLKNANIDLKEFVLCLPLKNKNLVNHIDLINLIDLDVRIIYLDDNKNYIIKNAYVIDSCLFGSHALKKRQECNKEFQLYINRVALRNYQNLILRNTGIEATGKRLRIFMGRKQQTRLYNQDEVFAFFKIRGFEMIHCEDLSLHQQIELFSQAEMITGPTGGSWTNLFFCKPDCKAFCWTPDLGEISPVYSIIGLDMGIDIRYDFFEIDESDWRTFKINGSYRLSQEFLEKSTKFMFDA